MEGKIKNGTIVTITASDYDVRKLHGEKVIVEGYSKYFDQYYVRAVEGQTCCWVRLEDVMIPDVAVEGKEVVGV